MSGFQNPPSEHLGLAEKNRGLTNKKPQPSQKLSWGGLVCFVLVFLRTVEGVLFLLGFLGVLFSPPPPQRFFLFQSMKGHHNVTANVPNNLHGLGFI